MAGKTSIKHLQIDKAKSTMLVIVAVASFVTILSLFATNSMLSKASYQSKVINEKHKVVDKLKANIKSTQALLSQYKIFAEQNPNILGGATNGSGNLDGDNARITLDALPSKYDAPALAASIEKLLLERNVAINAVDVKDDPASNPDMAQATPAVVPVNFSFESGSDYKTSGQLIKDFERSIRPFDITSLDISGTDNSLRMAVEVTTYYQPAKTPSLIVNKEVK